MAPALESDDTFAPIGGQGNRNGRSCQPSVLDPQQGRAYYRRILASQPIFQYRAVDAAQQDIIAKAGENP